GLLDQIRWRLRLPTDYHTNGTDDSDGLVSTTLRESNHSAPPDYWMGGRGRMFGRRCLFPRCL
ncbi:hypothetical protein T265_12172, partial [Opisthorchis viverrini]